MNLLHLVLTGTLILFVPFISAQHAPGSYFRSCQMVFHEVSTAKRSIISGELLDDNLVVSIPVIFHIVHNGEEPGTRSNLSSEQIYSQLEVLNEDFRKKAGTPGFNVNPVGADIGIEFCLALVDTMGNLLAEPGINRIDRNTAGFQAPPYIKDYSEEIIQPFTQWDPTQYLNIWVAELENGTAGWAQSPDSSGLPGLAHSGGSPLTDGIVLCHTCVGREGSALSPTNYGRTATHEIGHWLGLFHIWGVTDQGCSDDDFCDDTPNAAGPLRGCPTNGISCSHENMIGNYMDYSDDECMSIFTLDQRARMRTALSLSPRRRELIRSLACKSPSRAPEAAFSALIRESCAGASIFFQNRSRYNPSNYTWNFPGGIPQSSTEENPEVSYPSPGIYSVELTVSNQFGTNSYIQESFVTITNSGGDVTVFSEDFEQGLQHWETENPDEKIGWAPIQLSEQQDYGKAAFINLYDYTSKEARDALISPVINLSSYRDCKLHFEYAYQPFDIESQDSLLVYISTDGGQEFPHKIYAVAENGSGNFATLPPSGKEFFPEQNSDWCSTLGQEKSCIELDLSAFNGEDQVRIKFETFNGFGNNLFLDNISISGLCNLKTSTIPDISDSGRLLASYKAPYLRLDYKGQLNYSSVSGRVINMMGQTLHTFSWKPLPSNAAHTLYLSQLTSGMYIIHYSINGNNSYIRLLVP